MSALFRASSSGVMRPSLRSSWRRLSLVLMEESVGLASGFSWGVDDAAEPCSISPVTGVKRA